MKKILFLHLLAAIFPSFALAQTPSPSDAMMPSTPAANLVMYNLPYPGLLPDNILYPLKTFRDKIISFFISDPAKKASFDLLQSDKRIAAAQALAKEEKGKDSLVVSTVSKAENYFEEAIAQANEAKKQGEDISSLWGQMKDATLKYDEVLTDMMTNGSPSLKQGLESQEARVKGFEKTLNAGTMTK